MDEYIYKAKEEATSRKDIVDKVEKWMASCDEERWLEEYSRVQWLPDDHMCLLFRSNFYQVDYNLFLYRMREGIQ